MNILIHVSSNLIANAIRQLLVGEYHHIMVNGTSPANEVTPDVLLVDSGTLSHRLIDQHPAAKILLVDSGMEKEKLCTTLLTYRIHGILSPDTELPLFKKALKTVSEGQIWIDNASVKAVLHHKGAISRAGDISSREEELIACVCEGLHNKEIARRLCISVHTVKAHLQRIFKKLNIRSRSQLITLSMSVPKQPS